MYLCNHISASCPSGFVKMEGDIRGEHLGASHMSLDECADQCKVMEDCNSFHHSPSMNHCKLMAGRMPTDIKYADYMFCSKTYSFGNFDWM